mgnify:CR=1 FL=1
MSTPLAYGGMRARQAKIESAVLIGFHFNNQQQDMLKAAGIVVLSPATVCSRADLDQTTQLVAVSLRLPEAERIRIEGLVERRGTVLRALNENTIMDMLIQRFRRRKRHGSN